MILPLHTRGKQELQAGFSGKQTELSNVRRFLSLLSASGINTGGGEGKERKELELGRGRSWIAMQSLDVGPAGKEV